MLILAFLKKPTDKQIKQIITLYRQAGWWSPEASDDYELVARIISGSYCFVIALDDDEIIGMGRAISDGASDAYIQDVTVKESYRERGVGSKVISMLIRHLHYHHINWIGLIAEQGSYPFYKNHGFKKMQDAVPLLLTTNEI